MENIMLPVTLARLVWCWISDSLGGHIHGGMHRVPPEYHFELLQ